MNPICAFCSHGSCRAGNKCGNRDKKRSYRLQMFNTKMAKMQGKKQINLRSPNLQKKQHELDLKEIRNEDLQLNLKIVTLETSVNILTGQIKEEVKKSYNHTEESNTTLLDNDEYQCCICREVFIMPSLLNCSHMFCKWCIDKWLENNNQCPICQVIVVRYTHCFNMYNFIQRRMQQMPAKVRLCVHGNGRSQS